MQGNLEENNSVNICEILISKGKSWREIATSLFLFCFFFDDVDAESSVIVKGF